MKRVLLAKSTEAKAAVASLFEYSPPVLVEVRFPNSATSPDWYLFDEDEQLEELLDRLGAGAELRLSSVWDLRNLKGEILLRK